MTDRCSEAQAPVCGLLVLNVTVANWEVAVGLCLESLAAESTDTVHPIPITRTLSSNPLGLILQLASMNSTVESVDSEREDAHECGCRCGDIPSESLELLIRFIS